MSNVVVGETLAPVTDPTTTTTCKSRFFIANNFMLLCVKLAFNDL